MDPVQTITNAESYTSQYNGAHFDWHHVHIFSFNQILSTYFHPENMSRKHLKTNVKNIVAEIIKRSGKKCDATYWEANGKFVIAVSKDLFDPEELFEFNPEMVRYDPVYDYGDIFDFINDTPIDTFLENAFITVGAEDLIPKIEKQISKLKELQLIYLNENSELRALDIAEPKYLIEIYNIERNYIPAKTHELESNQFDMTLFLPENKNINKEGSRKAYIVKDINTGKVIENNIEDQIESIKHMKHLRKHPPIIDPVVLFRMELDNDDPDFLSYDDYVANDDEEEEGDAEYTPGKI